MIDHQSLGQVSRITMGQSPKGDTYNSDGDGLPLLNGPTEFGNNHPHCSLFTTDPKRKCKKGDLIFCVRGSTTGRMNWADKVYALGRGVCSFEGSTAVETRYIRYAIENQLDELLQLSTGGSTFSNLRKNDLNKFSIPWSQKRCCIASILSAYDHLIENNTRRITILEEMARRQYEEWFVHFRFPGHENVKMVESKQGLVPVGWEWKNVGSLAAVFRGCSYKGSELVESGGVPFINLKCIDRGGGFKISGLKRYTGNFKPEQAVESGDIVMAVTDMTQGRMIVARCGLVPRLDCTHGVVSMDMVKIQPYPDISKFYLYGMLRWSQFGSEVKEHATGVNVLHLHPDRISQFKLPVPPRNLRNSFAKKIAALLDLSPVLETKNTNLRAQRDLLIPRLISGEIEVFLAGTNTCHRKKALRKN